jgi:hypothetical protein
MYIFSIFDHQNPYLDPDRHSALIENAGSGSALKPNADSPHWYEVKLKNAIKRMFQILSWSLTVVGSSASSIDGNHAYRYLENLSRLKIRY